MTHRICLATDGVRCLEVNPESYKMFGPWQGYAIFSSTEYQA